MKKLIITLMFLGLSFTSVQLYGQEDIYLSSDQFVNEGIEFHDKGEYDKAVACYKKVSRCDPNYELACYELALSYYYTDKYDEALAKCKEALLLNYDKAFLYSIMGSILDDMGKVNEGIEILTAALKKWPYNQNLLYNLAACYLNIEQPDKAEEILFKSILINPYHTASHLGLAKANYMMGRITQSYLAYNMALLLNPSVRNLNAFEEVISQKTKMKNQEYKYPYSKEIKSEKWDEIKGLLQSEIAFNTDFDYDYAYNFTVPRQTLMLFRNLAFDPSDTSIYNRLYSRLFVELYKNDKFETYLNYILKNTDNNEVTKWSEKNKEKLTSFVDWAQSFLNQGRLYNFSYIDEQNLIQTYHYDDDGTLTSIGESNANKGDAKNGPWLIIGDKGYISERGVYMSNMTEGEWLVYYPTGAINQRLNFVNEVMDGITKMYYQNGSVERTYSVKAGKKEGDFESYSHSGLLVSKNSYSGDLVHGPGVYYAYNEGYVRKLNYKNDTLESDYIETWINGNPKLRCSYVKGSLNGAYLTWYSNSSRESEKNYKNDTLVGRGSDYYPNNQKSREYDRVNARRNKKQTDN